MSKINCEVAKDLLPLYIEHACSVESRTLVENHLEECALCIAEYKIIKRKLGYVESEYQSQVSISKKEVYEKNTDTKHSMEQADESLNEPFNELLNEPSNTLLKESTNAVQRELLIEKLSDSRHMEQENGNYPQMPEERVKSQKDAIFLGIYMTLLLIFIVTIISYTVKTREVSKESIFINDICQLSNGDIFFTLDTFEKNEIINEYWFYFDGYVYITYETKNIQLFQKYRDFQSMGMNMDAEKNWVFNVEDTGIKGIYYIDNNYYYDPTGEKLIIWENNDFLEEAPQEVELWTTRNRCQGNLQNGSFSDTLYEYKNPYIGNPSANEDILKNLYIDVILGNYVIQLQTSREPYEITLHFTEPIYEEQREAFDNKMKGYALIILALIDNASVVNWTYTGFENGESLEVTNQITVDECEQLVSGNIKDYGNSAESLNLLCQMVGID